MDGAWFVAEGTGKLTGSLDAETSGFTWFAPITRDNEDDDGEARLEVVRSEQALAKASIAAITSALGTGSICAWYQTVLSASNVFLPFRYNAFTHRNPIMSIRDTGTS